MVLKVRLAQMVLAASDLISNEDAIGQAFSLEVWEVLQALRQEIR